MIVKVLRWSLVALGVVLVVWLGWLFSDLSSMFVVSLILAYILNPAANWLESKGMGRTAATSVLFIGFFGTLAAIGVFLYPSLHDQIIGLSDTAREGGFTKLLQAGEDKIRQTLPFVKPGEVTGRIQAWAAGFVGRSVGLVTGAVNVLTLAALVPFVTFFLVRDSTSISASIVKLIPNRYFELTLNLLYQINEQLGKYLKGVMIEAAAVGGMSVVGLLLLGVPNAVIIGLFAGLANSIPYLGPVTGAVPAITLTLIHGGTFNDVIWIIGMFSAVQFIDNMIVQPFVFSQSVDLHPLTVLFVLLIGGNVAGVLGLLLALPVATIIKVTVRELVWGLEAYHIWDDPPGPLTLATLSPPRGPDRSDELTHETSDPLEQEMSK